MKTDRKKLDKQLDALNAAVDAAIKTRREWMDAHMADYAAFKVGDEIYDLNKGVCLGVVTELYRYHQDRDPIYDTDMSIDYKYEVKRAWNTSGMTLIDNTSSQIGASFGTRKQAAQWKRMDLDMLQRNE